MNEGEFSAPTQTFGRMLLKVFERVAGRPGYQARLSAGELHLVISTDGPRTLRAVHFDRDLVPRIVDTTAYFPAMVDDIMTIVDADPGIIERWQAGDVHFVYSADGVRLLRTEDFDGDLGPPPDSDPT
jgi:hypothetical protein